MYTAVIDSVHYTFQASGALWQDALVMQDFQTSSYWSQPTGKAIKGPMKGTELTLFPSQLTSFAEFKKLYPGGVLLRKPTKGPAGSPYKDYFASPDRLGIFGRANTFSKLDGKAIVFGVREGQTAMAVSRSYLTDSGMVILDDFTPSVLITYHAESQTASAFLLPAKYAGSVSLDSNLVTTPGGAQWQAHTGRSHDAQVPDLEPVSLQSSFWFAWATFFPETGLIQ